MVCDTDTMARIEQARSRKGSHSMVGPMAKTALFSISMLLLLPLLCSAASYRPHSLQHSMPIYGIEEKEEFFSFHAGLNIGENEGIADHPSKSFFQFDSEDSHTASSSSSTSNSGNNGGNSGGGNTGYDEDGNSFLSGNAESGYKSEFVVGKDRELLHVSIDLRWLYRTIVNPQHWKGIAKMVQDRIQRLHLGYNQLVTYREQASNMLVAIRALEPDTCNLRLLQCSLQDATKLALQKQRFIVFYVEEDLAVDLTPSMETLLFRRAFAGSHYLRSTDIELDELEGRNSEISDLINQKFFMMAGFGEHGYAKTVRSLVRKHLQEASASLPPGSLLLDEESFPMLVVLAPSEEDYEAYAQHQAALVSFDYDTQRLVQQVDAANSNRKKADKEKRKIRNRRKPSLHLPSIFGKKKNSDSLEVLGVMKIPAELILFATEGADDLDFSEGDFADGENIEMLKHREKLIRARLKERLAICEENVSKSVLQYLEQVMAEHAGRLTFLPNALERAHAEEAERQAQEAIDSSESVSTDVAEDVGLLEYRGQLDHSIDTVSSAQTESDEVAVDLGSIQQEEEIDLVSSEEKQAD